MSLVISLNGSSHTSLVLEPISFKELDTEGATFDVVSLIAKRAQALPPARNFWLASAAPLSFFPKPKFGIGRPTVGAMPG